MILNNTCNDGGNNMNKQKNKLSDVELYKSILLLETVEECMNFFDDLCTVTELQAMEQRFQVARLLDKGCIYNEILAETGASSATISRVNRCLQYGKEGYKTAISRIAESGEESK